MKLLEELKQAQSIGEAMSGIAFDSVVASDEDLIFTQDRLEVRFYHSYDCCESVYLAKITGELSDLENTPILAVDCYINTSPSSEEREGICTDESVTITVYKFITAKGIVSVKWVGTSNGYYGEGISVSLCIDRQNVNNFY